MQDALNRVDAERIVKCTSLCSLLPFTFLRSWTYDLTTLPIGLIQRVSSNGTVSGDEFGESDTRFSYILIQALTLLGRLDALDELYDGTGRELVVRNIMECMNFDGAFGTEPGGESHGGQGR